MKDSIKYLNDVASKEPENCNDGFIFDRNDDVVIYKMERDELTNVSQVTYVIRVDNTLRVQLFHKNAPITLSAWFRQGRNTMRNQCEFNRKEKNVFAKDVYKKIH